MRPILTPKQITEGLLRNLKRKVADAVEAAKREGLTAAHDLSPLPGAHPYATGEYARGWVWRGNRLVNTVEHAKYTDAGYTRYGGKGTARPWLSRGGVLYSDQIAIRVAERLRKALRG